MSIVIVDLDGSAHLVEFHLVKVQMRQHLGVVHDVGISDEEHNGQEQHRHKRLNFEVTGYLLFATNHRWEALYMIEKSRVL